MSEALPAAEPPALECLALRKTFGRVVAVDTKKFLVMASHYAVQSRHASRSA